MWYAYVIVGSISAMSEHTGQQKERQAEHKAKHAPEVASLSPEAGAVNKEKNEERKGTENASKFAKFFRWWNPQRVMALFTVVIAAVAVLQWSVYRAQLDQMRIDQRAWLEVKFTPFQPPIINSTVPAPFVVTNTGKTVAEKLIGWIYYRYEPMDRTIDTRDPSAISWSVIQEGGQEIAWVNIHGGVLGTNSPTTFSQAVMVISPRPKALPEPLAWTKALQAEWDNGEIYFALTGKLSYFDTAGYSHWTTFCATFTPPMKTVSLQTAEACSQFNSMDTNK